MIHVEERRQGPRMSSLDEWPRDTGGAAPRRATSPLREAALRIWDTFMLALMTVALVSAAAVFLLAGALELVKDLKLPPWLAYGLLGVAIMLAGFLLWGTDRA